VYIEHYIYQYTNPKDLNPMVSKWTFLTLIFFQIQIPIQIFIALDPWFRKLIELERVLKKKQLAAITRDPRLPVLAAYPRIHQFCQVTSVAMKFQQF